MRNTLFFLFALLVTTGIFAQKATVQVIDSASKSMPEWIEEGEVTGTLNGKKVIFFVGYGESKSKSTAKDAAELSAATTAAVAIKAIARKEVAKAWESLGIGSNEQKEQVMKGLEAISAKNVNVTGVTKTSVWWRQVVRPVLDKDGKAKAWSQPVYEYYVRFAMDYNTYVAKRDAVINDVKSKPLPKKEEAKEEPKKDEAKTEDKKETAVQNDEEKDEAKTEPKKEKKPMKFKASTEENTDISE